MLILRRRPRESVTCTIPPSDVERTLVIEYRTGASPIRLAIEAPPDIKIVRTEVLDKGGDE